MTIKEMEMKSGMSRANIRFYEAEGLLNPERRANGYREYSEEDLEILKKIKLLRSLHISLEEIKSLHSGKRALIDTLNQHLAKLKDEKTDIEKAQEICKVMRNDGAEYQTLNAQHYLDAIEQVTKQPVILPPSDSIPEIRIPWRRFFARSLDYAAYSALWDIVLALIFHVNLSRRSSGAAILDVFVVLIFLFLLEPILLSLFGTTLGKWILGIYVTNNEGERMTYTDARSRTWTMLFYGMGLGIPIFRLIGLGISYKKHMNEETLAWEYHSAVTLKDEKHWRIFAYLGAHAALILLLALALAMAEMPKNRGDITVAEFCENYNRFAKYYGFDTDRCLNAQGNWVHGNLQNVIYYSDHQTPAFIFEETNGIMTGLQFSVNIREGDEIITGQQEEMILAILAFAGAQRGNSLFSNDLKIVNSISDSPFESYRFSVYGVDITCNVVYSGYFDTGMGMLWPQEDVESNYTLSFSMQKVEFQ